MADEDVFNDHVESLIVELVTYVTEHLEKKVTEYNNTRKDTSVKPESPIDTIDEYVEGIKERIDMHIDSELRDMYNKLIYKMHPYTEKNG